MPTSLCTNLYRRLRVTEKKSDQVALPPDAGFGEDAFDVRANGLSGTLRVSAICHGA
jgi:hypothetical protein